MTNSNTILNQAWEQNWPAPAKINRFLHIVGQRADGYHLLQSVFQIIDFCDFLMFSRVNNSEITLSKSTESVEDKDNLAIKAAQLLQRHCQINSGVCISLVKNLPIGAGLGGGSSNAATTLLALNLLWECQLTTGELSELGIQLGADVPFFIQGQNAFVEGVGEKITPLAIDCPWLLLAIPDTQISTAEVFLSPNLTRDTQPITVEQLNQIETNIQQQLLLKDYGKNDCEEVVLNQYLQVKQTFEQMKLQSNPRLTGTGSCVFSLYNNESDAIQAIPNSPQQTQFIIKTALLESPIQTILMKFKIIAPSNNK